MGRLDDCDLSAQLSKAEARDRLKAAQTRMAVLRLALGGWLDNEIGPPLCVVFEGWDASGKGGAIKRLVAPLDPRHVRVTQFAAPTYDEKRHHFLWRFWPHLPGWGGMAVFDRSWYGRVLVERVEGFATQEQWERAYAEIAEFERTLAAEGMILSKFWMHVSQDEQKRRFDRRATDPLKRFKLTDEDWRNREKHDAYVAAAEDMFAATHTEEAPWHVIAGEHKPTGRVQVLDAVIADVERGLRRWGFEPPPRYAELKAALTDGDELPG